VGCVSGSHNQVAAGIEQDDGSMLFVMCDAAQKHLTFGFVEPRANWQKGAKVDLVLRSNDGPKLPPWRTEVINATMLGVWNAPALNILMMGQAKTSITISASGYTRVFPAANDRPSYCRSTGDAPQRSECRFVTADTSPKADAATLYPSITGAPRPMDGDSHVEPFEALSVRIVLNGAS
jgi:hypothetical protein